jgi:hypothetical protein
MTLEEIQEYLKTFKFKYILKNRLRYSITEDLLNETYYLEVAFKYRSGKKATEARIKTPISKYMLTYQFQSDPKRLIKIVFELCQKQIMHEVLLQCSEIPE